ncbi:nucleoredoxin-like protein 2 isoform X2 [Terrapene carolina triunguis]|uniref:nucleoredoxin-like protein 2 isoform X2 n=1 Tax=Terrapene triunguis TaxID=2587831 RepID=UPI000CEF8B65|nr:nucleoredoxin-like protein 2 isoform X2 [Terrapene carolina triunguis]
MVDVFSGRPLLTRDGHAVDPEEVLQNKIVGLYFSAGWCSPCRDFTPILCDFYSELLEGARPPAPFEIVFISSDRSPEEMVEYMHDMHGDWLALPFHDPYKHSERTMMCCSLCTCLEDDGVTTMSQLNSLLHPR